jgi:hypothetical protein
LQNNSAETIATHEPNPASRNLDSDNEHEKRGKREFQNHLATLVLNKHDEQDQPTSETQYDADGQAESEQGSLTDSQANSNNDFGSDNESDLDEHAQNSDNTCPECGG